MLSTKRSQPLVQRRLRRLLKRTKRWQIYVCLVSDTLFLFSLSLSLFSQFIHLLLSLYFQTGNKIGDEGGNAFAEVLKTNKTLVWLDMRCKLVSLSFISCAFHFLYSLVFVMSSNSRKDRRWRSKGDQRCVGWQKWRSYVVILIRQQRSFVFFVHHFFFCCWCFLFWFFFLYY